MAILTVTPINKAGIVDITTALVAADVAGDSYDYSSGLFIYMDNADAAPHTLTVLASSATANCGNLGELAVEDVTLVVGATSAGVVAVPSGYTDATGAIAWTYDAVTSVTIGVFSVA